MVDEMFGEKYARVVGSKGLGKEEEMQWFIEDIPKELKSWGHQGSLSMTWGNLPASGKKAFGWDAPGHQMRCSVVPRPEWSEHGQ